MQHTPEGEVLTEIILHTFKLNGLLVQEGDQLMKALKLTSARWKILGALFTTGTMTVSDIARMMGQSRQAVQRLSNEMTEEGLLVARTNPNHKRAKLFTLTAKGRESYTAAMQKQAPWVNALADELNGADLEVVSVVLKKLINQFET